MATKVFASICCNLMSSVLILRSRRACRNSSAKAL